MPSFAIRSLYLCRPKPNGTNIFEERIVAFHAPSSDEAFQKAQQESRLYALANNFTAHPMQEAYIQDDDPLIDGYELWSVMYESPDSLTDFYTARYEKYEYHPES